MGHLVGMGCAADLRARSFPHLSRHYRALAGDRGSGQGRAAVAIFTLVGAVNIPIIKFSVDWWHTLHQPSSVFRMGGPTIAASMLWPLLIMAVGFTTLFLTLHMLAIRNEIMRRRLRRLSMLAADGAASLHAVPEPAE